MISQDNSSGTCILMGVERPIKITFDPSKFWCVSVAQRNPARTAAMSTSRRPTKP
jgi:hypothetical protein